MRECSGDRVEVVRKAAEGKEAGLPKCEPHRLQLAVSQLLDDMEEKEAIPDRCVPAGCESMRLVVSHSGQVHPGGFTDDTFGNALCLAAS